MGLIGWIKKRLMGDTARPQQTTTATTFVEATGGGWDSPDLVPADGHDDYVANQLNLALSQAEDSEVASGETFEYRLSGIPVGIGSPHEIMFPIMMRASEFGLSVEVMLNEKVVFRRL